MATEVPRKRRKLSAILMADVSGFSALMGRDEEGMTSRIRDFHERVQRTVEAHDGRVVDTAGDSVFGEFDSVVEAVRCAHQIQADQERANATFATEDRIDTRIGVHLGDVIVEDYRVYGDGVNIAARLEQLAEPGGICVSEAVYQQVHNKLDIGFEDLGVRELKNILHPVRLYRVPPPHPEARAAHPAAAPPRAARAPLRARSSALIRELASAGVLVQAVIGLGLVMSPEILFPTGGVLPALGAVTLGVTAGQVSARRSGRSGDRGVGLGLGVAAIAGVTSWGIDALFVIGGLAIVASGITSNYAPSTAGSRFKRVRGRRARGRGRGRRPRRRPPA